ncbi:choice-of-anchor X domain-containing protein [Dactylosporangium darangshiense]
MQEAFAKGRCLGNSFADPETLRPGGDITLEVTIPAIATDGTITVYKADPGVRVTYLDPDGHAAPTSGTADGSTFELAGNSGTVEALRIRNPKPGKWTVQLKAPSGIEGQLVTASALWQGVLRSVFVLDPPSPAPGQTFTVVMRPHTRSAEITDPKTLAGLAFSARLTGSGVDTTVALLDDGKGPDAKANDAFYSASFQLPANASGQYTVRGSASGPGVAVDEHAQTFTPGKVQLVNAQIAVDRSDAVAGTSRSGKVQLNNTDTKPHEVRLVLKDLNTSGSVSVSPATATAAPGKSEFTYSLAFSGGATGPSGGVLQLVDAASNDVIANTPLGVTVKPQPGPLEKYKWPLIAAGVLLLVAAIVVVALVVGRVRAANLRGLQFTLYHNGQPLLPVLDVERSVSRFEFDIRIPTAGYDLAALQSVEPGTGGYLARLKDQSTVLLQHPGGPEPLEIDLAGPAVELPHLPQYAIAARRIAQQIPDSGIPAPTAPTVSAADPYL